MMPSFLAASMPSSELLSQGCATATVAGGRLAQAAINLS
jgi:hypothetical protein